MQIVFTATEAGYVRGIGSASNSKGMEAFHYLQFGKWFDDHAPVKAGHYFEYDHPGNRSVNQVTQIVITKGMVEFVLKAVKIIIVRNSMADREWERFLKGLVEVFGIAIIQMT